LQRGDEGTGPPSRSHDGDECFYVLKRGIEFLCDGKAHTYLTGKLVHVRAGTAHGLRFGAGGAADHEPWNKGKRVGQKAPLKLTDIWAIRVRLQLAKRTRELALFDLGIDSKLRACDLVRLCVRAITHGKQVSARAFVLQQKT
jgi:Cupin domain